MLKRGVAVFRPAAYLVRRLLERTFRLGQDDLRRTTPLHSTFGYHRGTPVDRYYIEAFLSEHATLVRGDGLEVYEDRYLSRFGADRLRSVTTFHLTDSGPGRMVGDLAQPDALPEGLFDCFICTQTLNFIFDVHSAMRSCHRLLRPGGHLLLTVSGISQISRYDADRWGDFWRFTPQGLERLGLDVFKAVRVSTWGNVLAATALLHGLVAEELEQSELDAKDLDYPVIISLFGTKS